MRLERFNRGHLGMVNGSSGQDSLMPFFLTALNDMPGDSWSLFAKDGTFLGCGGISPCNDYRALAWCLLHPTHARYFYSLHRVVRRMLDNALQDFHRIEAFVDPDFEAGMRWVKLLGFRCETPYKSYYYPDGKSASEWVKIREH